MGAGYGTNWVISVRTKWYQGRGLARRAGGRAIVWLMGGREGGLGERPLLVVYDFGALGFGFGVGVGLLRGSGGD